MGRSLILDTNVLIALERGVTDPRALGDRSDRVLLPTVVIAEFRTGIEMARTEAQARSRTELLDAIIDTAFDILDFTSDTARHFGVLAAHTIRTGRPRGRIDLQIAAHSLETGAPVLTDDFATRFDDLPGVHSAR